METMGAKKADFAVDARDRFTVHKAGCAHLRGKTAGVFDIYVESSRSAVLDALSEFDTTDGAEDVADFAPCLKALR